MDAPTVIAQGVVQNFAQSAKAFCSFCEQKRNLSLHEFSVKASKLLSLLHLAALQLPDVHSTREELLEELIAEQSEKKDVAKVTDNIRSLLKKHDSYWQIYNPYSKEQPVCGSLLDDFTDIYQDIKLPLIAFEKHPDTLGVDAVWAWRESFFTHWQHHAVNALKALQWIIFKTKK